METIRNMEEKLRVRNRVWAYRLGNFTVKKSNSFLYPVPVNAKLIILCVVENFNGLRISKCCLWYYPCSQNRMKCHILRIYCSNSAHHCIFHKKKSSCKFHCKFHSFIQVGLKSGGVNRFINEETDDEADLLPEHQDQLKHVRYDKNLFVWPSLKIVLSEKRRLLYQYTPCVYFLL